MAAASISIAPNPQDALGLMTAALRPETTLDQQNEHLGNLYTLLVHQPSTIMILLPEFISLLPPWSSASSERQDSLREWMVDLLDLAFNRPHLSLQQRSQLAPRIPSALLTVMQADLSGRPSNALEVKAVKIALQVFASVYQQLFRHACMDVSPQAAQNWEIVATIKRQAIQLLTSGDMSKNLGVRNAALKALTRVVQVQTRSHPDPRRQTADFTVGHVPWQHAFLHVAELEAEASEVLQTIITLLYSSSVPDLLMATMNSLSQLAKQRFQTDIGFVVLTSLLQWTPANLTSLRYDDVHHVEKTLQVILHHFRKWIATATPELAQALNASKFKDRDIAEAAERNRTRMETATLAHREVQELARRKRDAIDDNITAAVKDPRMAKRQRVDGDRGGSSSTDVYQSGTSASSDLASFDVQTLKIGLVIELIIANLQAISDADLNSAIDRTRNNLVVAAPTKSDSTVIEPTQEGQGQVVDPLKMDVGGDEELERMESERGEAITGLADSNGTRHSLSLAALENFTLAPPQLLQADESRAIIMDSASRLCQSAATIVEVAPPNSASVAAVSPPAVWSTLLTRLVTRGLSDSDEEGDNVHVDAKDSSKGDSSNAPDGHAVARSTARKVSGTHAGAIRAQIVNFLADAFPTRVAFARQWLAEEWFTLTRRRKLQSTSDVQLATQHPDTYEVWLNKLLDAILPKLGEKEPSLTQLLSGLPIIPASALRKLHSLTLDKAKLALGLSALRDAAATRPPIRALACELLLRNTRLPEKPLRDRAIISVRMWITPRGQQQKQPSAAHSAELEEIVLAYARSSLRRLTLPFAEGVLSTTNGHPPQDGSEAASVQDGTINHSDEQHVNGQIDEDEDNVLENESRAITDDADILRLVELPFALSIRCPDLLDDIFHLYPNMSEVVQTGVRKHITALVRSLGPSHQKLLSVLRALPPGTDSLALGILSTLSEKGRSAAITTIVKQLVEERSADINPRFLVPILPDLDKSDIIRYLPRVVTILDSHPASDTEARTADAALIRNVFMSIMTMPDEGFGSVSTNLPRVRQTELLAPTELMGLLHQAEEEIGIKTARDAINICFKMTDVFRSEILAAVLNQMLDEPNLPLLFMSTTIRTVTTYKSLGPWVSTTVLPRLMAKRVWQNPRVWEGFILCATKTAPGSYDTLMQLPREQLRDVVRRQPTLRAGLKEHFVKKAGNNKARLAQYMETLDDEAPSSSHVNGGTGEGVSTPASAVGTPAAS